MTTLFDGELHVHYGQFYVESRTDEFFNDLTDSRAGQGNGLCGAAVPGLLFLITGLHTGNVALTVEVVDQPPPVGDDWEEVVEVSLQPASDSVQLVEWAGQASWPLALEPVSYRVRYCASGMDQAHAQDTRLDEEPLLDSYLLQLWPAPAAPDAVLRQTSAHAAYWHEHAKSLPPPQTPEQRAEARERQRLAQEEATRRAALAAKTRRWGGRLPSERAERVNGASRLAELDRDLLDGLENLDGPGQRAVAVWAARRACAEAGLSEVEWIRPALAALEQGAPLPPPLDDHKAAFERLRTDSRVRRSAVRSYDGRHERFSQQHAALPALRAAAAADPLAAAVETVFHAIVTFGEGYPALLTEVRQAFPGLSAS